MFQMAGASKASLSKNNSDSHSLIETHAEAREALLRNLTLLSSGTFVLLSIALWLTFNVGHHSLMIYEPMQSGFMKAVAGALIVLSALCFYLVLHHSERVLAVSRLFLTLMLLIQAAAIYQMGTAPLLVSGHLLLILLLASVPARFSLALGMMYIACLYIFAQVFTLGSPNHPIDVQIFASMAILLWPLNTLIHQGLPKNQFNSIALQQLMLAGAPIMAIAYLLSSPAPSAYFLINSALFGLLAYWLGSIKETTKISAIVALSLVLILLTYNILSSNGSTLYMLPIFTLIASLWLSPVRATLVTAYAVTLSVLSFDAWDGLVLGGAVAAILFAGVLTLGLRPIRSPEESQLTPEIVWPNLLNALLATSVLCLALGIPFLTGLATFESTENVYQALLLSSVFGYLSFCFVYELLNQRSIQNRKLAQIAASQKRLVDHLDSVTFSGRIGTVQYIAGSSTLEVGGAFREIFEFPLDEYPELNIEQGLSRYTLESRSLAEQALEDGFEGEPLKPIVLELSLPQAGQRFVERRGSLQLIDGKRTLNLIYIDQTESVRHQREQKRLERAQKMALSMTKSIVIDLNVESGMATILAGDFAGGRRAVPFLLEDAFAHQLSSEDLSKMVAFLKRRREQITVKIINPGTDKSPFWARFSIGSDFMQDGVKHVLITRQNVDIEQNLRAKSETMSRQLSLALETGKISAFEVDIVTNSATLIAGYHPTLKPADQFNFIELKQRLVTREADIDRLQNLIRGDMREGEFRLVDSDGAVEHWVRLMAGKEYVSNNRLKRLITRIDITSIKAAFEQQRLAQERQRELFAIIGHELRTPVSAIEMIAADSDLRPEDKIEQITGVAETLLSVLEDMRYVVQPERALTAERGEAVPAQIVKRAVGMLQPIATQKHVRLHLEIDSASHQRFYFAAQSLRQTITNLVKNALIHAQAQNIWISLKFENVLAKQPSATLVVEDDGKGISKTDQMSLFEAFRRGDTDADGTGLGLFIVSELATRMNGRIEYQSGRFGGARFIMTFPLPERVERDPLLRLDPALFLSGKRVLLAEDDRMLRLLSEKMMLKAGVKLTTAVDGEEALALFDTDEFDLVITDIMMPRLDGYGLVSALRKRGFKGPVLGVTAAVIGEETDRLKDAGADIVLPKPIKLDRVVAALEELQPLITLS